jgi:hypothetical protein
MDDAIRDGARLSIADAAEADLEDMLEAIGIRMIFTARRDRSLRQWFRCPTPECHRRCAVLHFTGGRLVCAACVRSLNASTVPASDTSHTQAAPRLRPLSAHSRSQHNQNDDLNLVRT